MSKQSNNQVKTLAIINLGGSSNSSETQIRTALYEGQVVYSLNDIGKAIGHRNIHVAIKGYLDRDKILKLEAETNGVRNGVEYKRKRNISFVSRCDLYRILFSSTLPKAKVIAERLIEQIPEAVEIIKALEEFEIPSDIGQMYVYAVRNETTKAVKLGITRNPQLRLASLQAATDHKLTLCGYSKAENKFQDEVALHNKYKDRRVLGEWYNIRYTKKTLKLRR